MLSSVVATIHMWLLYSKYGKCDWETEVIILFNFNYIYLNYLNLDYKVYKNSKYKL